MKLNYTIVRTLLQILVLLTIIFGSTVAAWYSVGCPQLHH